MGEKIPTNKKETVDKLQSRIEAICERLNLRQQWEQQVQALNETGVLELLPKSTDIGIVDIKGNEQPIPTYEQIIDNLRNNPEQLEILEQKAEQYEHPKLLLVPIGMPIVKLIDQYKRLLIKKDKAKQLFSTNEDKLELDKEQPIYQESPLDETSIDDKLIYFPESFTDNPKGQTKQELIANHEAWQALVIEDADISRTNQSPEQYLEATRQDKQYQNEQGSTIESELIYAITKLHTENQQIDDWNGKGKVCWLFGNLIKDSRRVPRFYWHRAGRQAGLLWGASDRRIDDRGARSGVKIFKK